MAETVGVLKVRIDAEAGAALEALAQLERERDQAREVATHLMKHHVTCWSYQAELIEAYPWMKDYR